MMRAFLPVLTDPALRALAGLMVLLGAVLCSFGPVTSVLAVEVFGLGDGGFAALLVASSLISVSASVYVGIRADQTAGRRGMAMVSCGLMLAGTLMMVLRPGSVTFVLAHAVVLPLASTLFGQLFAQARLAAAAHGEAARDSIMVMIRALFALPFVVVLPLWSVAYANGVSILAVYPVCLVMAAMMLGLTAGFWPRDGGADRPSGLSFHAALAELAQGPLALRVLALGAVNASGTLYMALLGLVLVESVGRGPADVALYAGLVAGLEVPFMLAMPLLLPRMRRTTAILWGTLLYVAHVLALPLLAGSPLLWLAIVPAAAGGAVILTLPIAYLQDLLADRPGTGASLMALQRLTGDVMAAVCFAVGTAVSGYGLVAALGAVVSLGGAVVLHLADRRKR